MALVVVPDANPESYASVATATSYHAKLGNAAWALATESAQEIALRRATQFIDGNYTFRGDMVDLAQPLAFPRSGFQAHGASLEWPVRKLVDATCELALRALSGPLVTDVQPDGIVKEKVGPIEVEYQQSKNGGQVRVAIADDLLKDLVMGGGTSTVRLVRS